MRFFCAFLSLFLLFALRARVFMLYVTVCWYIYVVLCRVYGYVCLSVRVSSCVSSCPCMLACLFVCKFVDF